MKTILNTPTHKIMVPNDAVVTPVTIRKITKRAFMQRFTQAERIAVRNSTDDIVIDIYEDLKIAEFVDLDLDVTSQGLAYLESIGILESGRVDELLADGTFEEL